MGNARSGVAIAAAITNRLFPPGEQAARVKLVTLCFGANDASIKRSDPTWRFVPLADFSRLLHEAVDTLQAAGITNILLITPPPAAPKRVDRALVVTAEYAAAVKEVAAAQQVPLADLFSAVLAEPAWATSALLPDGLHLTPRGNAIMHAAVMAGIEQLQGPAVSPHALWEQLGPVTA
jgi:lysophospholipase L1-like esterase